VRNPFKEGITIDIDELIMFSSESHDDYTVLGVYKVIWPINKKLLDEIKSEVDSKNQENFYRGEVYSEYIHTLEQRGYIIKVHVTELHLGSYNQLGIMTEGQ